MADESYPELTSGDEGEWVAYLQRLLEYADHWSGPRPFFANGVFDAATVSSLRSFQVDYGVNPQGVADQATWEALVAIADREPGEPTPSPYGGQATGGGGEDATMMRSAMGGLGNLVLFGPSPLMVFSIIGLIGGLAERAERREREEAALEALRTTGDEYRRWTLAKAAANVLQDFLVSSDADGVMYSTSEAQSIQTTGIELVDLLHDNDWVGTSAEIGVVEGWLGNIPEDVWDDIDDRVRGLWNDMMTGLRSGTPVSNEGPDLSRGAIDVDVEEVHELFFSSSSHGEYYVKGR